MEYLFGRGRRQAEARAQEQESARLAAEEELQRTRLEAELERQRMEAEMTRLTASMRDADAASLAGREADAVPIRAANSKRVPGVPQDPLAPPRGPFGSSPDRESATGNAPAPAPGPLAGL